YLLEHAICRIHTCLPELFSIHLTKTLVSLHTPLLGLCLCLFFLCSILCRSLFFCILSCLLELVCISTKNLSLFLVGVCVVHFFASLNLVEGRLCNIEISTVDHRTEITVEQREEERANVCTIHVGVGRDD